jgi:hypothetical protein
MNEYPSGAAAVAAGPAVAGAGTGPIVRLLFIACIFTSSFLLFLVQPIIAKQILPWFGGTSAVWTSCLMFFQLVLFAGYAYSDLSTRSLKPGKQTVVHLVLLAAALACLPIVPGDSLRPDPQKAPIIELLVLLAATVGLPYFCLATTGPLLQAWYVRLYPQGKVYRLFALSNGASLVALLAYPFTIEPHSSTLQQLWWWSGGFGVFALLCGACAWVSRSATSTPKTVPAPNAEVAHDKAPTLRDAALWVALSAMGSAMLLAVTNHLTQNIAAVPFLWLLPLTLYLFTFVLCFEGRGWYSHRVFAGPLIISLAVMAWCLNVAMRAVDVKTIVPAFAIGFFCCCMFFHGELSLRRPAPRYLTRFYLCLSLGGSLGGMLVSLAAPVLLDGYFELPIAMVVTAALMLWLLRRYLTANKIAYVLLLLAFASSMLVVVMAWEFFTRETSGALFKARNFYASSRVVNTRDDDGKTVRVLVNGTIVHGTQYESDELRRTPTTYYGANSGVALAMNRGGSAPKRVGVVGLGVGTLAAYGRQGDHFRYYEINPHSIEIAQRDFSYMSQSRAEQSIVLGDARQQLQAELDRGEPNGFDVLVVDAFSSDSIPVHLITQEAMSVYRQHLKPGGVIAFHVSNLFLRLPPVVDLLAQDAGMQTAQVVFAGQGAENRSTWVLVTADRGFIDSAELRSRRSTIEPIPGLRLWTDSYNNLFDILR